MQKPAYTAWGAHRAASMPGEQKRSCSAIVKHIGWGWHIEKERDSQTCLSHTHTHTQNLLIFMACFMAVCRTSIPRLYGFDSIRILHLRGEIFQHRGNPRRNFDPKDLSLGTLSLYKMAVLQLPARCPDLLCCVHSLSCRLCLLCCSPWSMPGLGRAHPAAPPRRTLSHRSGFPAEALALSIRAGCVVYGR